MAYLGLFGPHACGKTTATATLMNWLEKDMHDVTIINCDNNRELTYTRAGWDVIRYKGHAYWKGKAVEKGKLVDGCVADDSWIYLAESVRFDVHQHIAKAYRDYAGGAAVVFLVCDWKTFRQFMVDRNKKNGRQFNAEYWTASKLQYEGHDRYINQAEKYLEPYGVPYFIFEISYDRHEWDTVLEFIWKQLIKSVKDWYQ